MNHHRYARIASGAEGSRVIDLFDDSCQYPLPQQEKYSAGTIVHYEVDGDEALIQSVVAGANTALSAIWLALSEHGVVPGFPAAVTEEVRSIVSSPGIEDESLPDLTDLPFVTIDNIDSRDLDQAMHISADSSGYTLHYALADAAYFVQYGTALFDEALRRGSSYYVPGFAVPMLPRVLSEGLVSLNETVLRRALVFTISFDQQGTVNDTTVQQARIRSAAKLSYTGVEDYYLNPDSSTLNNQSYTPTLKALRELGALRIQEARKRNVVEYNRSSVEISLSDDGTRFELTDSDRLQVEKYNEQISLICNAEGARLLKAAGIPSVVQAIYRVHEAPDEERLKKFSRLLKGLIRCHKLPPELWVWRWRKGRFGDREYLADYLERLKERKVDAGLLAAVQRQALMLSPASRFTAESGGHHSLKLDQYARFSSPMREIAGIYTHREYLQFAAEKNGVPVDEVVKADGTDDETLRAEVIAAANRSKEIQKRLNKAVMKKAIDQLFEGQLELPEEQRTRWRGTVMSLRSTRVYVQLESPAISVKIYLRRLGEISGVKYKLDKSSAYVSADDGSTIALFLAMGQSIELQVQGYSEDKAKWSLVPVS